MAMITIRARRSFKRTDRKLDVNGQSVGFEMAKVECTTIVIKNGLCKRMVELYRKSGNRGRENSRRTVTVETPTENALVAQDKIGGYDWSHQAEEEHPTIYALMAYTSSGSSSSSDSKNIRRIISPNLIKGYHVVPSPYTWNFIPFKPDLIFIDEIVESENMNVITIVTPSNVKKVESNYESADVKINGDAVEPKTVRKNSFRPPVIEDWNFDDDSRSENGNKALDIVAFVWVTRRFVLHGSELLDTFLWDTFDEHGANEFKDLLLHLRKLLTIDYIDLAEQVCDAAVVFGPFAYYFERHVVMALAASGDEDDASTVVMKERVVWRGMAAPVVLMMRVS
ncbi:hypothetical protein Tco_0946705 [Tanacetum coccineum]